MDSAIRGQAKLMAVLNNPLSDSMRKGKLNGTLEEREDLFWYQFEFDRSNFENQPLFGYSLAAIERVLYWSINMKVSFDTDEMYDELDLRVN